MRRFLTVAILVCGSAAFVGCSDSTKKADPKITSGNVDSRLKPAEAGGSGANKSAAAGQSAVKGD